MKRMLVIIFLFLSFLSPIPGVAQPRLVLPSPQKDGGKPLMQALMLRQSARSYSDAALTLQQLSNLLWAADGINREGSGKRTAPSANNAQEIDVYVLLREGTYLYRPAGHTLEPVLARDLRASAGRQEFVAAAAVNLVYVADISRMKASEESDRLLYSGADAGFIAQNVYLFCASEGLGTVVRGWLDRDALAKELNLKATQRIILAQTVGVAK
jgi:SagB-type dehydrogenase family enzyme